LCEAQNRFVYIPCPYASECQSVTHHCWASTGVPTDRRMAYFGGVVSVHGAPAPLSPGSIFGVPHFSRCTRRHHVALFLICTRSPPFPTLPMVGRRLPRQLPSFGDGERHAAHPWRNAARSRPCHYGNPLNARRLPPFPKKPSQDAPHRLLYL
jgi:hypothetical protein